MWLYGVLWLLSIVVELKVCQVSRTRKIQVNRLDECIEPLKSETDMQAPFFLVPVQPDRDDELLKLIRFDSDSGTVCFTHPFEHIKLTALSINQGLALNLDIYYQQPTTTLTIPTTKTSHVTIIIPTPTDHFNQFIVTCIDLSANMTRIGKHVFYSELEYSEDLSSSNFSMIRSHVSPNEANVDVECPDESIHYVYTLKVENTQECHLKKSKSENVIFSMLNDRLRVLDDEEKSSSAPIMHITSTVSHVTKTVAKLATLSFNLKLFTVLAITLASLLVVLIYAVFLTLKRFLNVKTSLLCAQRSGCSGSGMDSCGTIETQSSILMNELPAVNKNNPDNMFIYSNQYLSRLGIDMMENLRNLTMDQNVYTSSTFRTVASNSLPLDRWHSLLNWNVDFNTMNEVFEEFVKFK